MQSPLSPQAEALLDSLESIAPVIESHAREAEQQSQLAQPVVDGLREAGLFRMFRPQALGGFDLDPVEEFAIAEQLATLDGAAAWNVQVCNASELFGAWFEDDAATEVYGRDTSVVAGSFNPPRRAIAVDGGFRVTGLTPFVSNCRAADWIVGLADVDGAENAAGLPMRLLTAIPLSECRIVENWETLGLNGTGSHDVDVQDIFVPTSRAVSFGPLVEPSPMYARARHRYAIWATVGAHAAVALGIARAAIADLVELGRKVPAYNEQPLRQRSRVQHRVAEAEAKLTAARCFFHETFRDADNETRCNGVLGVAAKARCQLAAVHAAASAAEAVALVHSCAGTSGIRRESRFEKHLRDVNVVTQHAFLSDARLEAVGQVMFGLEPDWPFFAL